MFSGYKTYIVSGLLIGLSIAKSMGWIDQATYETLLGLLGAAGLTTLKMGQNKGVEEVKVAVEKSTATTATEIKEVAQVAADTKKKVSWE